MPFIQPYDSVTTVTICRFEIDRVDVTLFTSAIVRVVLLDANDQRIEVKILMMEGQDYANWGSNDDYIVTFVMNTLGFSPV